MDDPKETNERIIDVDQSQTQQQTKKSENPSADVDAGDEEERDEDKGRVLVSGSSKETVGTEAGWHSEDEDGNHPSWNLFAASPKGRPHPSPEPSPREAKRARDAVSLHASPAPGWPQRSPMKTEHEDVASLTLFTQSFETLSEGTDQQPKTTPEHGEKPPRSIAVGRQLNLDLGDFSPIKLAPETRIDPTLDRYYLPAAPPPPPPPGPSTAETMPPFLQQHAETGMGEGYHREYDHPHHTLDHHQQHPYPPQPPPDYYQQSAMNPFFVLRSAKRAICDFSYKLSCLVSGDYCTVNVSQFGGVRHRSEEVETKDDETLKVAKRRVETAVHAFGGFQRPVLTGQGTSIFRHRKTRSREYYEDVFHRRYICGGHHISWETEDNPPVRSSSDGGVMGQRNHVGGGYQSPSQSPPSNRNSPDSNGSLTPTDDSQQKMKYRCKLCGQLKQNHNCPYQQSLQRTIGVNVFPVVNAFTASEPGRLAKSLEEMNNFVSYEHTEHGGGQSSPEHARQPVSLVTPEANKARFGSKSSPSLSHDNSEMSPPGTMSSTVHHARSPHPSTAPSASPFVATIPLRPEHYRAVNPPESSEDSNAPSSSLKQNSCYSYPHVPLTFKERKRLSDTLFFLSKEVPTLTNDVASLLRTARERDEWDLAVAEILTQVVLCLYCAEGDFRLDGLQRYMLGLGVAC